MLEPEGAAAGRVLSIGFSKVVHQTSPRPCGGVKSVVNRPALAGGKACGQLPVDTLSRPRRSGLFFFVIYELRAGCRMGFITSRG